MTIEDHREKMEKLGYVERSYFVCHGCNEEMEKPDGFDYEDENLDAIYICPLCGYHNNEYDGIYRDEWVRGE